MLLLIRNKTGQLKKLQILGNSVVIGVRTLELPNSTTTLLNCASTSSFMLLESVY